MKRPIESISRECRYAHSDSIYAIRERNFIISILFNTQIVNEKWISFSLLFLFLFLFLFSFILFSEFDFDFELN